MSSKPPMLGGEGEIVGGGGGAVIESLHICVNLIDPAADQHIGVRRRQFSRIYMAAAVKMRAGRGWARLTALF